MQATQFRVGQPQNGLVSINDRPFGETKVRLINIRTKRDGAGANPGHFFNRINNCNIGGGLIFENAQLSRAIIGHGAITIEMIGREVKPETDRWAKAADSFQLKRADLERQHIEWSLFPCNFGERFADVAASDCSLAAEVQHLSKQFGRRRFAVRASTARTGVSQDCQPSSSSPIMSIWREEKLRASREAGSTPGV